MKAMSLPLCSLVAGSVAAAPTKAAPHSPTAPQVVPATSVDLAAPWPDVLTLANGVILRCRIRSASSSSLLIEYPRHGPGQQPIINREVPWSKLQSADFAMDAEFHQLAASTNAVKDTPRLAAHWNTLAPLVGRPHHPAGELGLAIARLSLAHPDASARHRALDICRVLAATDWNPSRRQLARLFSAKILAALGRKDQALDEARSLTSEPEVTPEAAMPAHLLLAEADFADLRKLEENNPRWTDDDIVRPEREALFHRALDAALKPSLFDGAFEEPASQGLWNAVQLLEFDHNVPSAADCARDLLKLYPGSPRALDAQAFLTRHRLPLDPAHDPPDPPPPVAASPTADSAASTTAPEAVVHRRPRYAETSATALQESIPSSSSAPTQPDS